MSHNSFFRRTLSAVVALILFVGMSVGQNLNLNGAGGTLNGTYNIKGNINTGSASAPYTFSGTVTLNGTGTQSVGGASGTPVNLSFATLNTSAAGTRNQTSPTVTVTTALSLAGGDYNVNTHTLTIQGTSTQAGTQLNASNASSTVNYTSGSAQTILAATYGGTLGISGAGAKDLGGAVTAAVVSHTASSGALTIDENLTINGGSASSLDAISVTASDILDVTGTGGLTIANVTSNDGTIRKTTSAGTITFSQASLTNAGTVSASAGTLTFNGDVANSGTLALTGTGTANFAEDLTNSGTLTLNNSGTTVNYTGTVAQSVAAATYYTLAMSGAGTKTAAGNVTIETGGSFNNGTATTSMGVHTLSGPSLSQAGGGTMQFAGTANGVVFSAGTVEYNGLNSITQTITAGTYATILLTNGSGSGTAAKAIANDATVITTSNFSVPTGVSLALNNSGSVLTVNGDLSVVGAITNAGTVNVGAP